MTSPHVHARAQGAPPVRELPQEDALVRAAQFLADNPEWKTGLRRLLREQFGIDDGQIMEAVLLANDMRLLRRVHG